MTNAHLDKTKRYDFLYHNSKRWKGIVSRSYLDETVRSVKVVKELAREMRSEGLYSRKTSLVDIERSVIKYISKLREIQTS